MCKPKLHEVLADLIENHSVDTFYVGNKGAFDRTVRSVLKELTQEYPQIRYAVVLERMRANGAEMKMRIIPTPYYRRVSRASHPALRFRGATSGCCAGQTMS